MAPKKTKRPLLEIATEADSDYTSQPMTTCNEKQVIDPHTIKLKMGPIGDKDPLVVREKNVKTPADVFKNLKYAEAQKRSFVFDLTDLDGAFKVIKVLEVGSKRLYTVEIFGLNEDKILAACQCPDYRHNEIAYCHHIAGIERLCAASEQVKTKLKFHNQNLDYFPLKVIHYNPSSKKLVTFGSGDLVHKTVSAIEQEKEPPPIVVDIKLMEEVERIRKQQPYKKDLLDDDVELYDYQQEVFYRLIAAKRAICSLSMGAGKAEPLTAKILTPTGWTTMGQIKVGDLVIGSNGKPTKVTGVFPQGVKDIYEVKFSDGATTHCCDEHLWQIQTPHQRHAKSKKVVVKPLKDFKDKLFEKSGNSKYFIPIVQPVEFIKQDLPLDPYLLGALLGDGCFGERTVGITTADSQMLEIIKPLLPEGVNIVNTKNKIRPYDFRLSAKVLPNKLVKKIRDFGLTNVKSWNKFIPEQYMYSSIEDRLSILQGLMDTDGTCDGRTIEFSTTSEKLADQVRELVMSLGGTATKSQRTTFYTYKGIKKAGRLSYRIFVFLPNGIVPFRLKRKIDKMIVKTKYLPRRSFEKVTLIGKEEAQCISVDAEDHLYVTDDYIVTHNTLSSICCYSWILRHVNENSKMLVIAPNSLLTQWEDEINRVKPNIKTKILKKDYDIHDWQDNTQVGIINYQMAQRYYESLARNKIDVVIADEIQFVKNSESKTWKALKKLSFEYFFALTGTPVENGLEDFYSIMSLIEPTLLGPKWKFDFTYHTVTELKPLKIVYGGVKDIDILKSKVENRLFSYTKLKLPPRTDHDVRINLETPEANSEANYMEMVARFASKFANRPPTFQELCILQGFLLRARQSCNSAELITKQPLKHTPAKVAKFVELVIELTQVQKRKVVVFSEWTQMISILKDQLTAININSVDFTGDQNIKQRKEAVKRFSTDSNCLVFFASDAGGTGLDGLQKVSDAVIHIELPWNPAKLDQRTGRIYRLGQKNPVDVYYFISKGTLEESIESALFRKRSVRQALMEGTNIATNADDKSFMATVLSNLREKKLNDQSV